MELDEEAVLDPFEKLPTPNSATLLVVGTDNTVRKDFAKSLVDVNTDYSLEVRTATNLPLPPRNFNSRPNIDLVVFLVDVNDNRSVGSLSMSLKHLDAAYFLGRVCFVTVQGTTESIHTAELTDVLQLCDAYNSPMLCLNPQDSEERNTIARQVHKMVEIAAGLQPGVSALLVQATGQNYHLV